MGRTWTRIRSNLHFAIDRLGFDGFRFDSVSSMLYKDRAIDRQFYGDYKEYFSSNLVRLRFALSLSLSAFFIMR